MKARCTLVGGAGWDLEEHSKCQQWSEQSGQNATCATASTTDDCIALVLVGACAGACAAVRGGGPRSPHLVGGEQGLSSARPQGAGCVLVPAQSGDRAFCPAGVSIRLRTLLILRTTHNECR